MRRAQRTAARSAENVFNDTIGVHKNIIEAGVDLFQGDFGDAANNLAESIDSLLHIPSDGLNGATNLLWDFGLGCWRQSG